MLMFWDVYKVTWDFLKNSKFSSVGDEWFKQGANPEVINDKTSFKYK